MSNIDIQAFFEQTTNSISYIVSDKVSNECAIIDSVLDFDMASGRTCTRSADKLVEYIQAGQLQTRWILESHAHADHLSAAPYVKNILGGQTAIGSQITVVQSTFKDIFNMEAKFEVNGSQFDKLLDDGDVIKIGETEILVLHTPGHTPACLSYKIDDAVFVGDTLFMPDYGTARADFPGGDAATLYRSIKRILALPTNTRVFTGHDYKTEGRSVFAWESTVIEQRMENIHVKDGISEKDFIEYRTTRDASLSLPKLILPAVQVNIRAGKMPEKESNGVAYLKIPINVL